MYYYDNQWGELQRAELMDMLSEEGWQFAYITPIYHKEINECLMIFVKETTKGK